MSKVQRFDPIDPVYQPQHSTAPTVARQRRHALTIEIVPKVKHGE